MIARPLGSSLSFALAVALAACGSVTVEDASSGGTPPPPFDAGAPDADPPPDAGPPDADPPLEAGPPAPPPDPGVRLSQGVSDCIKHASGTVTCWFHAGSPDEVIAPGGWEVPGIDDAVEVTDMLEQGCVRHATGRVSCWGWNHHGQMGLAIAVDDTVADPAELPGVELVKLTTGHHSMCGIRPSGQAVCWGGAYMGPLGAIKPWQSPAPVEVASFPDAIDISGSPNVVCAIHATGKVGCWVDHQEPVEIAGVEGAVQISAGDRSCAALATGHVSCWQVPSAGAPGAPVEIAGVTDAVQVSGNCARRKGGGVTCWDAAGALSTIPVDDAVDLSRHCAIKSDGSYFCWGDASEPKPLP